MSVLSGGDTERNPPRFVGILGAGDDQRDQDHQSLAEISGMRARMTIPRRHGPV
jgi:hypothetical protein